jgi:hypothetical protein
MTMKTWMAAAAASVAMLTAAGAAEAAVVYPVSAVASSAYGGYPGADAIDQDPGSEFSDWASGSQGVGSFLNLDLGGVYTLDQAYVTDRVTSGAGNNGWVGGFYDFTTQFSLQVFTDASFTTAAGSALVFNHAQPGSVSQPSDFLYVANLGGLSGQYIQYKVLAANGVNPGLSDIHFTTADSTGGVPEPAAWALMILGFGGAGAMLRRVRAIGVAA